MEAKPFRWVSRHRGVVIASTVLVVVGAIALPVYLHQAARDRELHKGDTLMQSLPVPADGSLQNRSSQHRDGWFKTAFSDSVVTEDTWNASYDIKSPMSLPSIGAAYGARLTEAGWSRDAACVAKAGGDADTFGTDGSSWYSDCWVKDGFSLSLGFGSRQQKGDAWVNVTMTDTPAAAHPTT